MTATTDPSAWIEAHGSPRLRRLVAEGIEHQAVYRDERLALERPGWVWLSDLCGESREPRNAPQAALDLLDRARELEPSASLVFRFVNTFWSEKEHRRECVMSSTPEDPCPARSRYLAVAPYMGKAIALGMER